jgi:hypothetical protein
MKRGHGFIHSVILAITLILMIGLSSQARSYGNVTNATSQSSRAAMPAIVGIYLNDTASSATNSFNVPSNSSSTINIKSVYPWSGFPTATSQIVFTYTIAPYPIGSVEPDWLQVSLSTSSVTVSPGSIASSNLLVTIDKTAQTGQMGSFELLTYYTDPITGIAVIGSSVISIVADNSIDSNAAPSNHIAGNLPSGKPSLGVDQTKRKNAPPPDPSWALGVGLCSSSDTTKCNGYGISWGSVNAEYTSFSVPSNTPSGQTAFELNAMVGGTNDLLQFAVLYNSADFSTWQYIVGEYVISTNTFVYSAMGKASSSAYLEIYYSSSNSGWYASDTSNSWSFSSYASGCCPSATTFYSIGAEPFAVESYDTTQSDFGGINDNVSPVFKYSTNGGSTWSSPPTGMVVDSNASSWTSNGNFIIGGMAATPKWYLEAGYQQCNSISSGQIYTGASGYVCSGALNKYDYQLF